MKKAREWRGEEGRREEKSGEHTSDYIALET
jgi:hypothetical protein